MNEEFEKWAESERYVLTKGERESADGTITEYYMHEKTVGAWDGWQASRKQALEGVVAIIDDECCDYCDVPNRVKALQKD